MMIGKICVYNVEWKDQNQFLIFNFNNYVYILINLISILLVRYLSAWRCN